MDKCDRPWGRWEVIEKGPMFKLKRLYIEPGQSISLQYHNYRSEVWMIARGEGVVVLDNDTQHVKPYDVFIVKPGVVHQVSCVGDETLEAIEVQIGEICEESDIVRVDRG